MAAKNLVEKAIDALRVENDGLKKTVETLKATNAEQLKRLVASELLKDRVRELEQQLVDKKGK
jgi:hypothetical protein